MHRTALHFYRFTCLLRLHKDQYLLLVIAAKSLIFQTFSWDAANYTGSQDYHAIMCDPVLSYAMLRDVCDVT